MLLAFIVGTFITIFMSNFAIGQTTLYSATFYGDGSGELVNETCKFVPVDCNVGLSGADALPILVNPWEPVSINIHCVELVFLPGPFVSRNTYLFVGNSYSPDIMLWATAQMGGRSANCFPASTSFPFPAAAAGAPANKPGQNDFRLPHLDVHVQGYFYPNYFFWRLASYFSRSFAGIYRVYLTVYYTKNPI
jgi:hypothetical protein